MKHALKSLIVLALVVAVVAPLSAEDEAKKKKKPQQNQGAPAVTGMMNRLKDAGLSEEQQAKIKEVGEKFTGKFKEAQGKLAATLGPQQRKARAEALKAGRAEGKKGKELQEAAFAALNLDADKLAELKQHEEALKGLQAEFTSAVKEVLTADQIEKVGLKGGKGKGKPGAAKKPNKEAAKKPNKEAAKDALPGNPKSVTTEKKVD